MPDDPLSKLLLDAQEIDREAFRVLQDYVGIDSKSGKVILKASLIKLSARRKVLAYLLGKKVAKLLSKIDNELTLPKEISDETSIPKGSVNPKLRELLEKRLIKQTKEGEYYIHSHQILNSVNELESKEEE